MRGGRHGLGHAHGPRTLPAHPSAPPATLCQAYAELAAAEAMERTAAVAKRPPSKRQLPAPGLTAALPSPDDWQRCLGGPAPAPAQSRAVAEGPTPTRVQVEVLGAGPQLLPGTQLYVVGSAQAGAGEAGLGLPRPGPAGRPKPGRLRQRRLECDPNRPIIELAVPSGGGDPISVRHVGFVTSSYMRARGLFSAHCSPSLDFGEYGTRGMARAPGAGAMHAVRISARSSL